MLTKKQLDDLASEIYINDILELKSYKKLNIINCILKYTQSNIYINYIYNVIKISICENENDNILAELNLL